MIVLPASTWKSNKQTGMASVKGIRGYEGKDYAPIDWLSFESSSKPATPLTLGVLLFPFAADLPASVFSRKKMGFAVPIGDWFRGELRPLLQDHLLGLADDPGPQLHLLERWEGFRTGRIGHVSSPWARMSLYSGQLGRSCI